MKRFSEQLHKKSQTIKLKKTEQADLRERIVSYMEYHPLPAEMKAIAGQKKKTSRQPLVTDAFIAYKVPFSKLFKYGGVFAAIVLVVVPFVAEQAVPGDTLYAVKVHINEEVRSSLTLDPYQKVEWETTRINRRIAEAKLLKEEGRLTEAAEAEAAAAVKMHANNAKAEIETLRASDADEATIAEIALDSTLAMQAQSFAARIDQSASSTTGNDLIAVAIGESLEKPMKSATSTLPALTKLTARAEQTTTRLRELETSLSAQVEASTATDIARRIGDIERLTAEAFALSSESEVEAQAILVDVLSRAQRLIVFMTDLGVRETVSIEIVTPVVLTKDEEALNRIERLGEIESYIAQFAAVEIVDQAVAEKLDAMTDRLISINSELSSDITYKAFIILSDEALALGLDGLILIEESGAQITSAEVVDVATSTNATSSTTTTDQANEQSAEIESEQATTTEETSDIQAESGEIATTTREVEFEEIIDDSEITPSTTVDAVVELDASIE